jgi:dihydroorotase
MSSYDNHSHIILNNNFIFGDLHPSIHHKPIVKKGGSKGGFPNANYKTSSLCMVLLCMDTTTTKEKDDL